MLDFIINLSSRSRWLLASSILILITFIVIYIFSTGSETSQTLLFSPKLSLQSIEGNVSIKFANNNLWETVRGNAELFPGDSIKTDDGFANLKNDIFVLKLNKNTEILFNEIKDTNSKITINTGSVWYRTNARKNDMKIDFSIGDLFIISKGRSAYNIETNSSGVITIDVVDGYVNVINTTKNTNQKISQDESWESGSGKIIKTTIEKKNYFFLSKNLNTEIKVLNDEYEDIDSLLLKLETEKKSYFFRKPSDQKLYDTMEIKSILIEMLKRFREYMIGVDSVQYNEVGQTMSGSTSSGNSFLVDMPDILKKNIYIVKTGDTIAAIALKYNVDWKMIARINNLDPPYILQAGSSILLPTNESFESDQAEATPVLIKNE